MLNKIKRWIYSKFLFIEDDISILTKTKIEKSCTRDAQTRKRVARAFQQQAQQMASRAMKAHDPKCQDPINCKKVFCYQWAPDKIIKVEIIKRKPGRPKKNEDN